MKMLRRLLLWLLLSVPLGAVAGTLIAYVDAGSANYLRGSMMVSGGIIGVELGILGGAMAALTATVFGNVLRRAGGSVFLTGLVVAGGLMALGFSLVYL